MCKNSSMNPRDLIVYGLLIALIGGPLLWAVISMIPKNKGEWNDDARRRGRYRARHWAFKESVACVKAFLLPDAPTTAYWPIAANTAGRDALSGSADTELGAIAWKSCTMETLGEPPSFIFTAHLPQLSDGREVEFPEVLLTRHSSAADRGFADEWDVTTQEPDAAQYLLSSEIQDILIRYESLHSAYFIGSALTVVCAASDSPDDTENFIDELIRIVHTLMMKIPPSLWV